MMYRKLRAVYNGAKSMRSPFVRMFPAGHFYSPLPDPLEIERRGKHIFRSDLNGSTGLDLRAEAQLELLDAMAVFYKELPFPSRSSSETRYYYDNDFFRCGDATVLYGMLRHFKPSRV